MLRTERRSLPLPKSAQSLFYFYLSLQRNLNLYPASLYLHQTSASLHTPPLSLPIPPLTTFSKSGARSFLYFVGDPHEPPFQLRFRQPDESAPRCRRVRRGERYPLRRGGDGVIAQETEAEAEEERRGRGGQRRGEQRPEGEGANKCVSSVGKRDPKGPRRR